MSFDADCRVLTGLAVTVVVGFGVDFLIRCVGTLVTSNELLKTELLEEKKRCIFKTSGFWIGSFERPLFFAAIWLSGGWVLMGSWFLMKTAFYWQSTNYAAFPETKPKDDEIRYLDIRHAKGNYHATKALVGTAANVVAALIGVAVGKWLLP